MNLGRKKYIIIVILVFFLGAATGSLFLSFHVNNNDNFDFNLSSDGQEKIKKIDDLIDEKFLWNKENKKHKDDEMIKAYVDTLNDPYTQYLDEEEYENRIQMSDGSFVGVGIVFSEQEDGTHLIEKVIEGGPAYKAGVKANSTILKINGKVIVDNIDYIADHLKGKENTKVTLTVMTEEGKEKTYELIRKEVILDSVESKMIDNNIGYIKISEFNGMTGKLFKEHIKKLNYAKGFVIDLRNNGGGVLPDCIEIADFLLGKQKIMVVKDNELNIEEEFSDYKKFHKPYVVLVNEFSASASEVLAGAIQDSGDSILIGVRTYGKGIIQEIIPLGDGTGMSLTVYEYFSPKGRKIHKKGLKPDIVIENTKDKDLQLETALEVLKGQNI